MHAFDIAHARPRRLSRQEYRRATEAGLFRGERVELIRGIVVEMSPIGPAHADPVDALTEILVLRLSGRARVRIQQPLIAADESEPEPDIAVVPAGRYAEEHPDRAHLVIEVAESSLAYDRETKSPLYASSAVAEYWILDVAARAVEVYRAPEAGRYRRSERVVSGQSIAIESFPDVVIAVADIFG